MRVLSRMLCSPLRSSAARVLPAVLGLLMLTSTMPVFAQDDYTTEDWIREIDAAYDKPAAELLPSAAVFPTVGLDGKICEKGYSISLLANFLYEFCPERKSNSAAFTYNNVWRNGGEFRVGNEITPDEYELYAKSLEADSYYFPILAPLARGYELRIEKGLPGDFTRKEIHKQVVAQEDYLKIPSIIAAQIYKDNGANLSSAEQAYLDKPQFANERAFEQFDLIAVGWVIKTEDIERLLASNPECVLAWVLALDGGKEEIQRALAAARDQLPMDVILALHGPRLERAKPSTIKRLLGQADLYFTDPSYAMSLLTYLHHLGEPDAVDHLIERATEKTPTYQINYLIARGLQHIAWDIRGNRFVSQTSRSSMIGFGERSDQAYERVKAALKINPDGFQAHNAGIIYAYQNSGGDLKTKHFNAAIGLRPRCLNAWNSYSLAMMSRWGGEPAEVIDFAKRAASTDDWDLGIPEKSLKALYDMADPELMSGFKRDIFANPDVWEVIKLYRESMERRADAAPQQKVFAMQLYAFYGALGGHYDDVEDEFREIDRTDYMREVFSDGHSYGYLRNRVYAETASGVEQKRAAFYVAMSVGDLDSAEQILNGLKQSDKENAEEYEKSQQAIELGRELLEKGEVLVTPQQVKDLFMRMSHRINAEGRTLRAVLPAGKSFGIYFPFGIRNVMITGNLKFNGPGVCEIQLHTDSMRDHSALMFNQVYNNIAFYRNRVMTEFADNVQTQSQSFTIIKLANKDIIQATGAGPWEQYAYTDVPSGFGIAGFAYDVPFEIELSDLRIKLVDPKEYE